MLDLKTRQLLGAALAVMKTQPDNAAASAAAAAASAQEAQTILESIPPEYSALADQVEADEYIRYTSGAQLRYVVGKSLNTSTSKLGQTASNVNYILMPDYIFAKAGSTIGLTDYTAYKYQVARYSLENGAFTCLGVKTVSTNATSAYTIQQDCYVRFAVRPAADATQTDDSLKNQVVLDILSLKVKDVLIETRATAAGRTSSRPRGPRWPSRCANR